MSRESLRVWRQARWVFWGAVVPAAATVLVGGVGSSGCTETPASGTLDDLTISVTAGLDNTAAVELDILWVIDNSSSMGEEQNSLAANLDTFSQTFASFNVDIRMAVVNTDGRSESAQGAFQNRIFDGPFTPNSFRKEIVECLEDSDCEDAIGEGWKCEPPLFGEVANLSNENCSLNSECRRSCADDAECQAAFDDPDMACLKPGGDDAKSRCQKRPDNAGCPDELPLFVSTADDNLDLFRCLAIVGTDQGPNANLEQGLNAAVWALDRNPESGAPDRSQQAATFLRENSWKLIIFVSDEEDCSLDLSNEEFADITAEDEVICGCLNDASDGGPLAPINELVGKVRSLGDSDRVLVAAIVGDVVADAEATTDVPCLDCTDPAGFDSVAECVESRRELYFESKCKGGIVAPNTKVCQTSIAAADLGNRYIEFVQQFGDNGFLANICNDAGFGPALENISNEILTRLVRFCLPRPVLPGQNVRVTLNDEATGDVRTLTEGVDYEIECTADCLVNDDIARDAACATQSNPDRSKAIFFLERLQPQQQITIEYDAGLF